MSPDPSIPETCHPLDLASPVLLRKLAGYETPALTSIEARTEYTLEQKIAAEREVRGVFNNLRNIVALSVLESSLP